MTVRELIELLRSHAERDGDLPVYIEDWNEQYEPDHPLESVIECGPGFQHNVELPRRVVLGVNRA